MKEVIAVSNDGNCCRTWCYNTLMLQYPTAVWNGGLDTVALNRYFIWRYSVSFAKFYRDHIFLQNHKIKIKNIEDDSP
jgi:hypothetical protein